MGNNTKAALGIGGVIAVGLVAFLAFGVFGIQTLFIDETVDEANPFETAVAAAPAQAEPVPAEVDPAPAETEPVQAEAEPLQAEAVDAAEEQAEEPVASEPEPAEPAEPAAPQITTVASGSIINHDHAGTGTVNVITNGVQSFLRFEDDFAVDNGPDLNVYLVRGAAADGDPGLFDDDFIDLGDLKGNIGAQNYELDPNLDIGEYDVVVIWCVRFGVAFNAAALA